ncbi:hypothetical protein [Eubacterium sp.]|uniref:hypothetical protein n=1 Tax=Eubacterium sp. TaxID=142586 RepID=UPI0025FADD61|nr:hypothetical protein [Eubacterium sp.]MCR5629978.1 hypothetical protein [Eubacterium sp.]
MINNATQLKAKVRNVSNGNDNIAKSYIRIFFIVKEHIGAPFLCTKIWTLVLVV